MTSRAAATGAPVRRARPRRSMLWRALGLWILALLTPPALAQTEQAAGSSQEASVGPIRLTSRLDRPEIVIGDQLRLTLSVEAPAGMLVSFPEIDQRLGPFTVISQSMAAPDEGDDPATWRQVYVLEPEDVGELEVPALTVHFLDPTADQAEAGRELASGPLAVTVRSVVPEGVDYTEPRDIAPPVELPRPQIPAGFWLALGLVAGGGLLAVLWWRRRRRIRHEAPAPPQPAHLLALAELERLQGERPSGPEQIERFHVRLSSILRRYLMWRFGLRAPLQTTEEFLATAPIVDDSVAARRDLLGTVLGQCDLVKFARHRPAAADMREALARARTFVEQTGDPGVMVEAALPEAS